jgi:hypothetical protein
MSKHIDPHATVDETVVTAVGWSSKQSGMRGFGGQSQCRQCIHDQIHPKQLCVEDERKAEQRRAVEGSEARGTEQSHIKKREIDQIEFKLKVNKIIWIKY